MKMTEQDYKQLKSLLEPAYKARKPVNLWHIVDREALRFVCDVLYKYLNDHHISTALRRMEKEFQDEEKVAKSI